MKNLRIAFALIFVFAVTGIGYAAVDSERTLPANTVQPESCRTEIDRQEGAGWELVEQIDVDTVDLLEDYIFTVSVTENVRFRMRAIVNGEDPAGACVTEFIELRATGVCVR